MHLTRFLLYFQCHSGINVKSCQLTMQTMKLVNQILKILFSLTFPRQLIFISFLRSITHLILTLVNLTFSATYWSSTQLPRLRLLNSTCSTMKHKGLQWNTFLDSYLSDSSQHLAYCHIPKVASTWWISAFARAKGYSEEEVISMEQKMVSLFSWELF